MKNDEQFVRERYKDAMLHPVQSNPKLPVIWHVLTHPKGGGTIGTGNTEEAAWSDAAKRIDQLESGAYI